jgi:hypothetical protein
MQLFIQERFCTTRKTFASDAKGEYKTHYSFALFETRKEATMT